MYNYVVCDLVVVREDIIRTSAPKFCRGVWIRWTGTVEWNGGMDWNEMEWNDRKLI